MVSTGLVHQVALRKTPCGTGRSGPSSFNGQKDYDKRRLPMAEYLYKVQPHDTVLSVCLLFDLTYEQFSRMNPDFGPLGHRYAGELRVGERLIMGNSNNVFDKLRIETKRYHK